VGLENNAGGFLIPQEHALRTVITGWVDGAWQGRILGGKKKKKNKKKKAGRNGTPTARVCRTLPRTLRSVSRRCGNDESNEGERTSFLSLERFRRGRGDIPEKKTRGLKRDRRNWAVVAEGKKRYTRTTKFKGKVGAYRAEVGEREVGARISGKGGETNDVHISIGGMQGERKGQFGEKA